MAAMIDISSARWLLALFGLGACTNAARDGGRDATEPDGAKENAEASSDGGDTVTSADLRDGAAPVCTPGADQTCNDDPRLSSLHGRCNDDRTCTCHGTYPKNPATGRCM